MEDDDEPCEEGRETEGAASYLYTYIEREEARGRGEQVRASVLTERVGRGYHTIPGRDENFQSNCIKIIHTYIHT